MSERKRRLLARLDTMTHPLQISAVMHETPVIPVSELNEADAERFAALGELGGDWTVPNDQR